MSDGRDYLKQARSGMTAEEYGILVKERYTQKAQLQRIDSLVESIQKIINKRNQEGFRYSDIGPNVSGFVDIESKNIPKLEKKLSTLRVDGRKVKFEFRGKDIPHDEVLVTW